MTSVRLRPFALGFVAASCFAQTPAPSAKKIPAPPAEVAGIPVKYDEAKVGSYTLPDPLVLASGGRVRDARTRSQRRRPEIVRLFEENQYGRASGRPSGMTFDGAIRRKFRRSGGRSRPLENR